MKEFAIYIDYKAGHNVKGYEVKNLTATNLLDAMAEAEKHMTEDVYLVTILAAEGRAKSTKTYQVKHFREQVTNRGYGWHNHDKAHSESNPHLWERFTGKVNPFTAWSLTA